MTIIAFSIAVQFIGVFVHEMGHAIAVIISGGTVYEFHVELSSGYILRSAQEGDLFIIRLMGGIFQAGLFFFLTRYSNYFKIPMFLSIGYGIGEAFGVDDSILSHLGTFIFIGIFAVFSFMKHRKMPKLV